MLVVGILNQMPLQAAIAQSAAPEPDFWQRDTLLGDWGGLRSAAAAGLSLGASYIGETLADVHGGIRRDGIYEGRLELSVDADLDKIANWGGAKAHADFFQIHGRGIAPDVGSLVAVSNIEARPSTRLFTLWVEQSLPAAKLSIRLGKIAADDEFLSSDDAGILMINSFGWTTWTSFDVLNGGPIYPLAAPGIRVKLEPTEEITVLSAVFSGDPAGSPSTDDLQARNSTGTRFSFHGGAFFMEEVAYRLNQGKDAQGLASTFKLGAWAGAGSRFPDQRFDTTGRSLADPLSNGIPRSHASDYGLYGIVDQTLWQAGGGDQRRLAAFARVGGSPSAQNLIDFYSDGGLTYQGLLPERQNDVVGVGVIYSRIGAAARGLDLDARSFGDPGHLVRSGEVAIETTYQIQLAPWWTLQPDLQYIIHPGGTIAPPGTASNSPIPNALVIGLRTTLKL